MRPRSPSPMRGRPRARSVYSNQARSVSQTPSKSRRSITPRSISRSPRRTSRYKSESRSRSRSPSHGRSLSPPRSTKIVVEKLTKNVTADHLREIFGSYGTIRDLDMPMNRQFDFNRGTAYILYSAEVDAEAAIAHMHESQIDGAVVNVSIVLPRRKFSPSPPPARRSANIDARPPTSNFRNGPPPSRRRSPAPTYGRSERNFDTYRPGATSRSRSPRRYRTRSRSISSPSRTPPRRRGARRSSLDRNVGRRRRSPSYSSYSSYDDRSRSRSHDRGGYRRR